MTSADAIRCESVTEPSEFGHIITMGLLAIPFPKPLDDMVKVLYYITIQAWLTLPSILETCRYSVVHLFIVSMWCEVL